MLSHVWLFATPWTVAPQVPLSMGFPRQEYWSGLPFPFPITYMAWIKNSSRVHSIIWVHSVLSVQSLSCVQHLVTPWTVACKAFLSINNFQSLLKLLFIESVMSSNHLILCCPLLLLLAISPRIRVFSNESVLHIRWPKHWSISPSNEYSGLISFRMDWLDPLAVQGTLFFFFCSVYTLTCLLFPTN